MAKVEASKVINRPIEEVFTFAANIENNPKWQDRVLEARVTSEGPISTGSTFRYVEKLLNRIVDTTGEITEYNPNRNYFFKSISGPFKLNGGFTFESVNGGTKVALKIEAKIGGFFKLAEPIVVKRVQKQLEADLAKLKDILEN